MFHIPLLIASLFHYIDVPVQEMRLKPCEESEQVSQLIFSEQVTLVNEENEWLLVKTSDQYEGWIKKASVCTREDLYPTVAATVAKVNRLAVHLYKEPSVFFGPLMTLPFESRLEVITYLPDERWIKVALPDGGEGYIQSGDITLDQTLLTREEVCKLAERFLGLPYTWGGRSSFGYDCSGFVQMLYRQMGVALPRNSRQQQKWEGFKKIAIEELSPGDLIFFGTAEDQISHVGMYLGNQKFIHTSAAENMPYLRISDLTDSHWCGIGLRPYRTACTLKQ